MPARNLANRQNQNNNMTTPNIQFEGKKDHNGDKTLRKAGTLTTGALAASMLLGGMGSCDKLDVEHDFTIKVPVDTVEKYIPVIQPPDTVYQIKYDTIADSIIVRDTINQIITKHDTIWMKPEYDSPVAPIIKKFYQVLNINPGNGKIPVKMAWTMKKMVHLINPYSPVKILLSM